MRGNLIRISLVKFLFLTTALIFSIFCPEVFAEDLRNNEAEIKVIETFPVNGGQDVFPTSGIEITFNTADISRDALKDSLSIMPELEYYVIDADHEGTFVICPVENYEPKTQYRVTIKAGLMSTDGRRLQEDVTFSFSTADEDFEQYYSGMQLIPSGQGSAVNVLTDEIPAAFLMVDQELAEGFKDGKPEAEVTLYRFETDNDYLGALLRQMDYIKENQNYYRRKIEKDPAKGRGLTRAGTFQVKAEPVTEDGSYWWWSYDEYVLSFPETLPEGKYLAKLDFPVHTEYQDRTITKYLLVQSTEMSVFMMASGQESVAWLHNGVEGGAVEGAQFFLYNASSAGHFGETKADGTAVLSLCQRDTVGLDKEIADLLPYDFQILDVRTGDSRFIEAVSGNILYDGYDGYYGYSVNRDYYTYIYTDRQIYSTTDEVHFFGVLKPRRKENSIPDVLTIRLESGWWGGEEVTAIDIRPDEKGCFTGSLSFEDQQASDYAYLSVEDEDGKILMSSDGFSLEDYVKPTYTSTIEADRPVYVLGKDRDDEAVIRMNISYFDGTPAADFGLMEEWSDEGLMPSGNLMTADSEGNIEDCVKFDADCFGNTWRPQYARVNYRSADIEDEILYLEQELMIIPRDVMLTAENDPETQTLTIGTYAIDTSGIETREDLYETDNFRGEGISAQVSGTMYKCWYEKISDGIRYDYIYKRSYEAYHYEYHKDTVQEFSITTSDGEGGFSYRIEQDEENPACYYVLLKTKDSAGRSVECTAGLSYRSLGRYMTYGGRSASPEYQLKAVSVREKTPEEEDPEFWAYYFDPDNWFSEDSPAEFVLVRDGEEFAMPDGAELLSASLQSGFGNIESGMSPKRSVAFSEKLIPNYYMTGAYFDGKNTWPLQVTSMVFDYNTRELALSISADQESFRPGDTVTVTVDVARKKDGNPVPEGTKVAVGVVDEAVFALREQYINLLQTLYGRFSIRFSSYSSRNTLSPSESSLANMKESVTGEVLEESAAMDMAASGMGMEAEHVRSEFLDMAYFSAAETDADGKAVFTFRVPDNMTSWRVTALAVTDDIWAGNEVSNIICTTPYYTVPVLNDIMLEGDTFTAGLRSAGTVEDKQECSYEVSVRRAGEDTVLYTGTAEGKSLRDYTWVSIDGLTEGSYIVRIKGICGEYTDVSEYPFEVVRSGLEAYVAKSGPAGSILEDIHPLRYPVTVMIYDRESFVFNAVLSQLLCSREIRADERLGAHYALSILASEDGYFEKRLSDHDISDLQNIFPQFRYGKNNAEISALAYLAMPELIGSRAVRGIVPEDISQDIDSLYSGSPYAAYLLQALSGEHGAAKDADDLCIHLQEMIGEEGVSFRDRIYLMSALHVLGMEDAAAELYDRYAVPYYKSALAVSGEEVYYLDVDENTTVQDDTAAALIMASLLHREESRGLALYLLEKPSDKDIYPLEEVLYLKNCEEKDAETCTVSYMLDGGLQTETLRRNRRICLSLQKKELEELSLTAVSGEPYITVLYIAGMDELTDESTMKLHVSVAFDKDVYLPGDEAVITVTPGIGSLDPSIGCSTMVLDIYLPSGMRFLRYTPETYGHHGWYLVSREGQRLRYLIYDSSYNKTGIFTPVTFTASCVTPGTYIIEKAYLSSNHYDTWGLSKRGSVTIAE